MPQKTKLVVIPNGAAMACCFVPLYDMLMETVCAIEGDFESSTQMRSLARRGRNVLRHAKAAVYQPKPIRQNIRAVHHTPTP